MHKIFFYNKFIIHPYTFRALLCSSTGGQNCALSTCAPEGHLQVWWYQMLYNTILRERVPSVFPTKTLYAPLSTPIRATCPAHLILDFITRTILGEEYRSFSSSLCNLLHSPVTSSLLGPNILLDTLFSNTLSFLFSLNISDQVSHP